jgi:putative ABC transport system permease protein
VRLSSSDFRIAVRSFARHRGFSIVAVLSLGLAIALNTTMYSVLDAMINPRVDVAHPDQLYALSVWGDRFGKITLQQRADILRSASTILTETATFESGSRGPAMLEHGRRVRRGAVAQVSPNIFRFLGIRPAEGRAFTDADYTESSSPVVISTAVAGGLFPFESAVGSTISIDGSSHPIIGVIDRASQVPGSGYSVWMLPAPTAPLAALPANIARLRPGLTLKQAEPTINELSHRFGLLAAAAGEPLKGAGFLLKPIEYQQFHFAGFHFALIGAVLAVLLIACANLANLQLARGLGRSRELALRTALGATRRDIIAQLLLESAVLATAGLAFGLLATVWGNKLLEAHIPPSVAEYVVAPQTSWRMFAFGIVACVVCVIIIGLVPALHVSRADPNELLKSGAGTGANARNRRKYSLMIMVEMGLALAVLSGTALVVRSALVFNSYETGFDLKPLSRAWFFSRTPHVAVHYVDAQHDILSRLAGVPDVASAAVTAYGYLEGNGIAAVDAHGDKRAYMALRQGFSVVSPGYLRTMGIPIIQGHDFTDGVASDGELIIDEQTALYLWPDGRWLGNQIKLGSDSSHAPWVRVVGVSRRIRNYVNQHDLDNPHAPPPHVLGAIYYRPAATDSFVANKFGYMMDAVVRARRDPQHMPLNLRRAFATLPSSWMSSAETMEDAMGLLRLREGHNFVADVFELFTFLALGLASLGIYGVVAHSVAERKREIGVRIALGADTRQILRAVLREGNAVALGGVAVGLFCTKYTMQWLQAFSFEGDEYDAPLFAAMAAVLFIVAIAAALGPALKATRIDPVESMRAE